MMKTEKETVKEIKLILGEIQFFSSKYPQEYINFEKGEILSGKRVKKTLSCIINMYKEIEDLVDFKADLSIRNEFQAGDKKKIFEEKNGKKIEKSLKKQFDVNNSLFNNFKLLANQIRLMMKLNKEEFEVFENGSDFFKGVKNILKGEEDMKMESMLERLRKQGEEFNKLTKNLTNIMKKSAVEEIILKKKCSCTNFETLKLVSKSVMTKMKVDKIEEYKQKMIQGILECNVEISQKSISDTLNDNGNRTFLSFCGDDSYLAVQNNCGYTLKIKGKEIQSKKMQKCKFFFN